jgi:hypothetical protein
VQRRSYLSIVVVGNIPFDLSNGPAFWVVMTIWVGAGAAVWHLRTEELLARFVYRLRSLSELEKRRVSSSTPMRLLTVGRVGLEPTTQGL